MASNFAGYDRGEEHPPMPAFSRWYLKLVEADDGGSFDDRVDHAINLASEAHVVCGRSQCCAGEPARASALASFHPRPRTDYTPPR
jgi:hypothetical protein